MNIILDELSPEGGERPPRPVESSFGERSAYGIIDSLRAAEEGKPSRKPGRRPPKDAKVDLKTSGLDYTQTEGGEYIPLTDKEIELPEIKKALGSVATRLGGKK